MFERHREFSKLRWTQQMYENKQKPYCYLWDLNCKSGSVAYHGHPKNLHLWRFKLEILQSLLPLGTLKPDIQMQTFLTWDFFLMIFFSEKNQNLLDIQEAYIHKLGKIWSELKLLFGVYYWFLKLYTGIIWQLFPFAWDFIMKGQQLVWGQVG